MAVGKQSSPALAALRLVAGAGARGAALVSSAPSRRSVPVEVVTADVEATGRGPPPLPEQPVNLDFADELD